MRIAFFIVRNRGPPVQKVVPERCVEEKITRPASCDARQVGGRPYLYALVQRLQKGPNPAIRRRRGKWFPTPESEQSQTANGTGD